MKISERSIILIHEHGDTIIVDDYLEELLREKMRPILWHRNGLYCVIPVEVLMNALNYITMYSKLVDKKIYIHWSQGQTIHHDAGCALSGSED